MSHTARSRLGPTFDRLRASRVTGLITFVTAGDPSMQRSADILKALDRAGADVLEVGVPFSDPLADGPVIQRASERALDAGATLTRIFEMIASLRADVAAPIVLFTYANPVERLGLETFARAAAEAGVDGVLVVDLPVEESDGLRVALASHGLDMVFLLSPTTRRERIEKAAALGSGFLYGISRLGVTGAQEKMADGARSLVERIREVTDMPVAIGFGLSRPEHLAEVGAWADAAVVGSGLVRVIEEYGTAPELIDHVSRYVRWLKGLEPAEPWAT